MRRWFLYVVVPWFRRLRERAIMRAAWCLPKSVAYWSFIRVATANGEAHHPVVDVLNQAGANGWYHG